MKNKYYLRVIIERGSFTPDIMFDNLDDATDYAEALLKSPWGKALGEYYIDLREDPIESILVFRQGFPDSIVLFDINAMA